MRALQILEKIVIIVGVGLAVFPLWAWVQETEDREITRSAMRLAAYEYCYRIQTNQLDLVGDALNSTNFSAAAFELAAYADEIVEEECSRFQQLAEQQVAEVAPPAAKPEQLAFNAPSAAAPAGGRQIARSAPMEDAEGLLEFGERSPETATFAPSTLQSDAGAPGARSDGLIEGAGYAPKSPEGRLERGAYVLLPDACGGAALALGPTRVMCADGATQAIDAESYAPIGAPTPSPQGAAGFERLVLYYTN